MSDSPDPTACVADAGEKMRWGKVLSWALYDFANTIYSAIVVSLCIALHVKELTGVEKYTFLTMALSLLASGLFVPFAGELADRTGRSKRYLCAFTVLCCASCAALSGVFWAPAVLALFFIANFCYNSSLVFYDSLLPVVAPPHRRGLISGIGVGLGYGGVAFAVPIAMGVLYLHRKTGPEHELAPLFALAAVMFLALSVPLFLCVPERKSAKPAASLRGLVPLVFRRTLVTIRALPRHRNMFFFLLGNFFCVDAVNATIIAYAPYVENVLKIDRQATMFWMIPFSIAALALGVLGGRLSDRFGSRPIMLSAALSFMLTVVVCGTCVTPWVFFPVFILFGGYGLATIWIAGRRMLLSLAPPGQLGKYAGLYNVGHKLSMIGVILFGILADLRIGWLESGGYRLGLLVQIVSMVVGAVFIWKVKLSDATG